MKPATLSRGMVGEWFGPPVLILRLSSGESIMLDGRKRINSLSVLNPPTITVGTYPLAIKHLIEAGHYERALNLAEKAAFLLVDTVSEAVQLFNVSHWRAQSFVRHYKRRYKKEKAPRRALSVVKRALKLKEDMKNGKQVTLNDIEYVLGAFNE